jgi:hypothetical protein
MIPRALLAAYLAATLTPPAVAGAAGEPGNDIGGPGFTVSVNPSAVTIFNGGSVNTTITVVSIAGFSGSVDLAASGVPPSVLTWIDPPTVVVSAGGTATSTVTFILAMGPVGTTPVTITGTSGVLMHSAPLSLTIANGPGPQNATFDPVLQAPMCATVGSSCDSGTSLILGRDGVGPEPNQPNTIHDSCADGASGAFHVDESIDRITVEGNGSPVGEPNLAAGRPALLRVVGWAAGPGDRLELFYAANANAPDWIHLTSFPVGSSGAGQVGTAIGYILPTGPLQAVRARIRYHGRPGPCGRGPYEDHDDLVFAVDPGGLPPDNTATFDATLQAPRCSGAGRSCDSGPTLLLGRHGRGPEPNQPNTVGDSCPDGASGLFHRDESNDRLRVGTNDGTAMAPGKTAEVSATVWASREFASDRLDLYYAADASAPVWIHIGTRTPTAPGQQTLGGVYAFPSGSVQAVRARFRYGGTAAACGTGAFDDTDDLVFAVP